MDLTLCRAEVKRCYTSTPVHSRFLIGRNNINWPYFSEVLLAEPHEKDPSVRGVSEGGSPRHMRNAVETFAALGHVQILEEGMND